MNSKNAWMLATPLLVSLISVGAAGASETQPSIPPLELKADYTSGRAEEAGVNVGLGQQVGTGVASRAASSWLVQGDLDDADTDDLIESDERVGKHSLQVGTRLPAVGLTAAMLVAALPNEGFEFPFRDPPRDEEGDMHPKKPAAATLEAQAEPGGAGWSVGGVVLGTLNLGTAAAVASGVSNASSGLTLGVTIAAGVIGGVGGYFLGTLARQGSSVAKVIIVTLTVLDVLVPVVGGLVATSSMHMNQGSLFGGSFTE